MPEASYINITHVIYCLNKYLIRLKHHRFMNTLMLVPNIFKNDIINDYKI